MLVLASASPRRKELLSQLGYTFQVVPSAIPEERLPNEAPVDFVTRLAREKAQFVYDQLSQDPADDPLIVLGADTIVVAPGGEILGKPRDTADAERMLESLGGGVHRVITGVCLISAAESEAFAETTLVTMQPIPEEEILAYVATGEPMDKAGAYAIQGRAARWIPRIEGCYFNVVGLPLAKVVAMIARRGFAIGA